MNNLTSDKIRVTLALSALVWVIFRGGSAALGLTVAVVAGILLGVAIILLVWVFVDFASEKDRYDT